MISYHIENNSQATAWKWKKLDLKGDACISSTPGSATEIHCNVWLFTALSPPPPAKPTRRQVKNFFCQIPFPKKILFRYNFHPSYLTNFSTLDELLANLMSYWNENSESSMSQEGNEFFSALSLWMKKFRNVSNLAEAPNSIFEWMKAIRYFLQVFLAMFQPVTQAVTEKLKFTK